MAMDVGQSTDALRSPNDAAAIWPGHPVSLARGRQPRSEFSKTVNYTVSSLEDFEASLRQYLADPPEDLEHTDCQLSFWIGTSFIVQGPASMNAIEHPHQQPQQKSGPNVSLSIMEALSQTQDPKEKMRKQRSIAKCCVAAISRVDGYRYSFHNCWNSREDDSYRFSYYCNDSLLNKDRAANGKGAKVGKRATKPVYDCKGVLSIKFSATKSTLDVFYKHVPVHKTYEERAPPPRKDSKRRKFLEENDPDALQRIFTRPRAVIDVEAIANPTPFRKKQKQDNPPPPDNWVSDHQTQNNQLQEVGQVQGQDQQQQRQDNSNPSMLNTSLESDLRAQSLRSLLELIQVDPPAATGTSPPAVSTPPTSSLLQQASHAAMPAMTGQQSTAVTQYPVPPQNAPVRQAAVKAPVNSPRRRPRNSCDVCKVKKTKCDGTRPVCQTCIDRNRQCSYAEAYADAYRDYPAANRPVEVPRPPPVIPEPVRMPEPEPVHIPEPVQSVELTEIEKMRRELEEARARIQELEAEKRSSSTPSQVPAMSSRPQSQPQAHQQAQTQQHNLHVSQAPVAQTQPPAKPSHATHAQQMAQQMPQPPQQLRQHQQHQSQQSQQHQHQHQHQHQQQQQQQEQQQRPHAPPGNHRQQLQQLNQPNQRGLHSPRQGTYKVTQSPKQRIQQQPTLHIQTQQSQQHIQTPQQQQQKQQQKQQQQQQQLQASSIGHQRRPSQNVSQQQQQHQQQSPIPQNYFATAHANHAPFATINRPLSQNPLQPAPNSITAQNPMATPQSTLAPQQQQNPQQHLQQQPPPPQAQQQPQQQQQGHPMAHPGPAGMSAATAQTVDASNPYARAPDFGWVGANPGPYYGYQTAPQQQTPEQWAAARAPVFR